VKYVEIPEGAEPIVLALGEVHFRDFSLAPGEILHVLVEQQGLDVALLLRDPQGKEILKVDSPNGRYGPEEILQIADLPGPFRLEVQPSGRPEAGRYALREASRHLALPQDRERVAADRLDREGRRLIAENAWPDAIGRLSQARGIWHRLGSRYREAETLRQLGRALSASGDLPAAREVWEQALSWYRVLGVRGQSFLLQDLGKIAARLGDPDAAVGHLEEARSLFEQDGDERGLVYTLSALGAVLRTQGSYQRALECFETAVESGRRLKDLELEASVQVDRGALLLDLDRTEDALAAYQRALDVYRGLAEPEGISSALRGAADAHIRANALGLAEKAAVEAIAVLGADGPARGRVAALSSLGNVHRKRGDWVGARQALTEALTLARAGGYRRDEANLLTSLAYATARGGAPLDGLELYDQALRIFQDMGNAGGEAMVQARSAEALHHLGRLDEAWRRVDQALQAIESLRAATNRQDYRLSYFGSRQEYYEIAVDILLDLESRKPGSASRAFAVHERRLARELLDALALTGRRIADPAMLAEEQRLEGELSELAGQPEAGTDDRLAAVIEDLQRIRGHIRAEGAGQDPEAEIVDLEAVQTHLLDEESLALVYALGGERSHLFEISRQDFRVHRLPGRELIDSKVSAFIEALQRTNRRHVIRQESLSRELGNLLLPPAGDRQVMKKRLVVVADGSLQGLPFAALASPGEDQRFLGERHEIIYLPSFSMFARLRSAEARRPAQRGRLGVFADPVFSADEKRSSANPYPRLPESRREAEALQRLWGSKGLPFLAVRFEARRDALLKTDWSGFETLYFATHAVGHRHPGLSGLVLSMLDAQGRPQPGFVSGLEISRLSLPVDLVVLSACETASGDRVRGEGTLGLSWSFLQAGASRVVATLWEVDDRRTADLMTRFLELYRRDGLSPSAALHRAQREALGRPRALPRDWAGFVFIGDWRTRHLEGTSKEKKR
jgi:CHAT domain-containing protein/tetratricopeptide (TPR) repeat protein